MNSATHEKPNSVTTLEMAYGAPSQAGFGAIPFPLCDIFARWQIPVPGQR